MRDAFVESFLDEMEKLSSLPKALRPGIGEKVPPPSDKNWKPPGGGYGRLRREAAQSGSTASSTRGFESAIDPSLTMHKKLIQEGKDLRSQSKREALKLKMKRKKTSKRYLP